MGCSSRDGLLNVKPVEIGCGDAGFKEHGRATRAFFEQVELAPAPYGYPAANAGKAQAIAMGADALIEKSHADQGCRRANNPQKNIHE
jgi:hypothetical protein